MLAGACSVKVVLLDDDEIFIRTLSRRLQNQGFIVDSFTSAPPVSHLIALAADAYLLDLRFGQRSGLDFIEPLRAALPDCRIFVLTGFASIATAVQAVKSGADDYLTKPVDFSVLQSALQGEDPAEPASEPNQLLSADQIEWEHIQRVLAQQDGNISQTARLLGMHRRTLQRKLQKHRPA